MTYGKQQSNMRAEVGDSGSAAKAALEVLNDALNAPTKHIPFHWYSSNIAGRDVIDINMIYPLVCAWCEIDVSIAESILKGVFFLQSKDGAIAARYLCDGSPLTDEAPWPLILNATKKVWQSGQNEDFIDSIAPRLYRYIDWICYHFNADVQGAPEWQSMEESLFPTLYDASLSDPDLCILIASELEALLYFEGERPKSFSQNLDIQPELDRFIELLQEYCWDRESEEVCFRKNDSSEFVKAPLIISALMGMCFKISPELRIQVKPKLVKALELLAEAGTQANTIQGHLDVTHILLLMSAARESRLNSDLKILCATLMSRADAHLYRRSALPTNLSQVLNDEGQDQSGKGESKLLMATLIVSSSSMMPQMPKLGLKGDSIMQRISRNITLAAGIPIAIALLTVSIIAIITIRRQDPTLSMIETSMGLANKHYRSGDYHAALEVVETQLDESLEFVEPHLLRARILFRLGRYDEAMGIYERLIEGDQVHPAVKLNLGVVHYRKDNFDDAIQVYRSFLEEHGSEFPLEAARARDAIELLENRAVSLPTTMEP